MKTQTSPVYTDNQIREMMLRYFYERNKNATSRAGKNGSACKISDVKADLKARHGLKQNEVVGNLNYLISQGWIDERTTTKTITTRQGTTIPQETITYIITAAGIDKQDGPSPFTNDRFAGIHIEGQNVVTIGNSNHINVKFKAEAEALNNLRKAVTESNELDDTTKLEVVTDIDTVQTQLIRATPNKEVIRNLWEGINRTASVASLADLATKVGLALAPFFS